MSRPVVLIYDRAVNPVAGRMPLRLAECRQYALAQMWIPGGEWWDSGSVALTASTRPRLREVLALVPALLRQHPEVVLLVHSWDRLSADQNEAERMQFRIEQAGARVAALVTNVATHECSVPESSSGAGGAPAAAEEPTMGTVAADHGTTDRRGRPQLGVVISSGPTTVRMRPLAGGRAWTAETQALQPVRTPLSDALVETVAEVNRRPRWPR